MGIRSADRLRLVLVATRPSNPAPVPGVLHRLLLAPLLNAFGRVGADAAGRAGAALGVLAFHLGVRRRVVSANLALCLGLRGTQRRMIARRSFAAIGANFVELWTFGHPDAGPERGLVRMNPRWQELVHRRHPGAVFLALHLGSWDIAACAGSIVGPFLVYAKPQRDLALDALLNRQRALAGMDILLARHGERTGAITVLRALRADRAVGLLADQKPSADEGKPAWFLGQATPCHAGPAFFAIRARVPMVPGICIRTGAGRYAVFYGRPIFAGGDEGALLQAGMDRMSAVIAAFPGQYFWHHRRFKRLSELPPRAVQPWRTRGLRLLVDREDSGAD